MRQTISNYIDKICFISEDSVSKYRKTIGLLPKGKVAIAYLGTQKSDYILSKQSTDGWLRIVSCANLKSGKRINLIIEAIALAARHDNIKIQWTHFGGGDLQKEIDTLAAESFTGKDNIKWTLAGNVPNCDIHSYYKANPVDLFLSMSESEGVPVSFMEAMSYGIPVMTTDVGGVREIVNDGCGIMLEKSDAGTASDAILKFNSLSGAERQKLRNRAYKIWNEKFNGDKNFSDFADKYLKG
jgi:glycosyltransferase involved in cell wall biosynthesis